MKASEVNSSAKQFAPYIDIIPLFNHIFPGTACNVPCYGKISGEFVRQP